MSVFDGNFNWSIPLPEQGETDSVLLVHNMMEVVDGALLSPEEKAAIIAAGETSTLGNVLDAYSGKYVNTMHYHPTPTNVPHADDADLATDAGHATNADTADAISVPVMINGHEFDGSAGFDIVIGDIPDYNRHYCGTADVADFTGFPATLRNGDLYIKYN